MFRSNFVIPRVALFVLFVGFSTLALNPLVRWGIARTGQSVTGARVDIAKVRSSLMKGYVTLEDVQAVNPRHPMKNLFTAEHIRLNVDTAALKQRRFVITDGQATGLRIGNEWKTSGARSATARVDDSVRLAEPFVSSGANWLRNAAQTMNVDSTEKLPSVAISRQLAARWPTEQARIDEHSTYVHDRIAQIQKLIDESGENPLRNLQPYQQAIEELVSLQNEAFEITGGMSRLRQQLLMDQNAVREARKQDQLYLDQLRQIDALDGEQLSEYLIGPELDEQIREVLDWVRWGRKQIPTGCGIPLAHRDRGEFLYFSGIEPTPATVIQKLTFIGHGIFGDEPVEIEGVVRGLSSHPELSTEPVELRIQTVGPTQLLIQATSDSRGDVPRDHILANCPSWPRPGRTLGQNDKLAVDVSPGAIHLQIRMEIVGDSIDGEVTAQQKSVVLQPRLAPSWAGDQISELVALSLQGVDQIETHARLAGTIEQPVFDVQSSLGPTLASGIAQVIDQAMRDNQQRALAAKYRGIDAMIAELDQLYEQKNQELVVQFETRRNQIERIKEIIATRVDQNDGVTDEKWPLRETFRR